jgi:hypothetical protein
MANAFVSTTKNSLIDVFEYSIKKSNQLTCVGWVSQIQIPSDNPLILLAVSDLSGEVLESDSALRFEIVAERGDYRLKFAHSKSKLINKSISVRLDDPKWHFVSYVCTGEGIMQYYVDGLYVAPEDGTDPEGPLYTTAWSRSVRQGGGDVWCPYLYELGQAVSLYNWRFVADVQIHQQWIQELMAVDIPALALNQ